jgi:hypothetical protein
MYFKTFLRRSEYKKGFCLDIPCGNGPNYRIKVQYFKQNSYVW